MKNKTTANTEPEDKDTLSQADIKEGIDTVSDDKRPHMALETPRGKNNGAEPAVFENQRKAHT